MLKGKAYFSQELSMYERCLAKDKFRLERYRFYLFSQRKLKQIEIEYTAHYNNFLNLIRVTDDYCFDGQLNRIDSIHSNFQNLLVHIHNAKIKRFNSIGRLSNRKGGVFRLVAKQHLDSSVVSVTHLNEGCADA